MIGQVVVLSNLHHRLYFIEPDMTIQFHFLHRVDLYDRSRFVVQSHFYHIPHIIQSFLIVQYCILRRSQLYN